MYDVKLKYIILDDILPVIFPEGVGHNEISHGTGMRATSAGFVTLVPISSTRNANGEITRAKINSTVYGESISLGIGSRGDHDNAIIEKFLNRDYGLD